MDTKKPNRLIFVSGLSGAGKSIVLHALEDLNFYCIDNLPIGLLDSFKEQLHLYPSQIGIGINARNQELQIPELVKCIDNLRKADVNAELVYLEADNDVLTKRYSETRRKHPFSNKTVSLQTAIFNEQQLLAPLAEAADLKIDTTHSNVHELRKLISERVAGRDHDSLSVQLVSFGFKNGTPRDADFVFDVRCLPNPYWETSLRSFVGKDREVIDFLGNQPLVLKMTEDLTGFLDEWLKHFEEENRSYLTIAIGCTGGRHRSVYLVDRLAEMLTSSGRQVIVKHRDL